MSKTRLISLAAMVAGLLLGAGVFGAGYGRADAAPADEIEATLAEAAALWNAGEFDEFVTLFTEEGLAYQFGETDLETLMELLPEIQASTGLIESYEVTDIFVSSANATGIVYIVFENQFIYEKWDFRYRNGSWKISDGEYLQLPPDKLPEGAAEVDLYLDEYAFLFDPAETKSGNFVFQISNVGEESHEVVLVKVTTGAPLGDVLDTIAESGEDEEPEGIEFVSFGGFYEPRTESTAVFPPLDPGRYALICFLPSPDDVPHAFLGMIAEFKVGSGGGGITPPSTGDGGLARASAAAPALGILALTLFAAGAAGLLRRRA